MGDTVQRLGLVIDPSVAAVVDSGGSAKSGAGGTALSLKVSPEVLSSTFAVGPEIGVSFSYGGNGSVFGWSAGLKADFDMPRSFDALRLSAGYVGERLMTGNTTEHGVYSSIAWYFGRRLGYVDRDHGSERFRKSTSTFGAIGLGPYIEYFPDTKRVVGGLKLGLGFDVL